MEHSWWKYDRYNMLNQLRVTYASDISDRWPVFAGPVLNFQVRNIINEDTSVSTYQLLQYSGNNSVTDMWIGINTGFRFCSIIRGLRISDAACPRSPAFLDR